MSTRGKILFAFLTAVLVFSSAVFFFSRKKVARHVFEGAEDITAPNESPDPAEEGSGAVFSPDSIPAMSEREYSGSDLKLGAVLDDNESYTRYFITYRSEGLTISGILNVPKGQGPFPVLILNHGFIEPKFYRNGQGLKREQDFLTRRGYAVLHSDYRNHAQSNLDPAENVRPRSGYVEDVLNAVSAVRNSSFDFLDKENIGMLGHSMGGGIALNVMVTKPEAVKAMVLLAPINSSYRVNFDKWVAPEMSETAQKFYAIYGRYEDNPEIWESFSARNYFSKVGIPVLLHQGTLDKDVPVEWSRELSELLQKEGKDITYFEYPGEPHTFIQAQPLVMQRTLDFFNTHLKQK